MIEEDALDKDMTDSVIEHMNSDHSDACVAIVRAFSPHPEATSAIMQTMDRRGLEFKVVTSANSGTPDANATSTVRVNFSKPLVRESQIRGQLVALSKLARAKLSTEP